MVPYQLLQGMATLISWIIVCQLAVTKLKALVTLVAVHIPWVPEVFLARWSIVTHMKNLVFLAASPLVSSAFGRTKLIQREKNLVPRVLCTQLLPIGNFGSVFLFLYIFLY